MTEIGSNALGARDRYRHRRPGGHLRELPGGLRRLPRPALGLSALLVAALVILVSLGLAPEPVDPIARESATVAAAVEEATAAAPRPAPRAARGLGEGRASYYSDLLEGRPTASGQPYRGAALTAAHPSLPFGSRLRVTNLANGRSVVVQVNDRGPFDRRYAVDLSLTAARRLDMLHEGHAPVRIELLR